MYHHGSIKYHGVYKLTWLTAIVAMKLRIACSFRSDIFARKHFLRVKNTLFLSGQELHI